MQISEEQRKRTLLHGLIIELSKSQNLLKSHKNKEKYYKRLESIYYNSEADNFRHYYSDIFAWLTVINSEPGIGDLDILTQNIQVIKDDYRPIRKDNNGKIIDVSKEIAKLYDHTNLEIARINYTKTITDETNTELAKVRGMIDNVQKRMVEEEKAQENADKSIKETSAKLKEEIRESQKKMQNEYITILGIFASIVIAFTSGMAFSVSVFENIEKASAYRLLGIILILGLFLFNLLWLLIDFLREINGKTIRRWWVVIAIDSILALGLILTFAAYKGHWLEERYNLTEQQNQNSHIEHIDEETLDGLEKPIEASTIEPITVD